MRKAFVPALLVVVIAMCASVVIQQFTVVLNDNVQLANRNVEANATITAFQQQERTLTEEIARLENDLRNTQLTAEERARKLASLESAKAYLERQKSDLAQQLQNARGTTTSLITQPVPTARIVTRTQYVEVPSAAAGIVELVRYNPVTTPEDCNTTGEYGYGCVAASVRTDRPDNYGANLDGITLTLYAYQTTTEGPVLHVLFATMDQNGSIRWSNVPHWSECFILNPLTGEEMPLELAPEVHGELEVLATKDDITDDGGFKTRPDGEPVLFIVW